MNTPGPDAAALAQCISAIIVGYGHGGLTHVAERLGMSPSAFRKRLLSKPFDEPTMRATLLVAQSKAENYAQWPVETSQIVGPYVIETRNVDGEIIPTWRQIEPGELGEDTQAQEDQESQQSLL